MSSLKTAIPAKYLTQDRTVVESSPQEKFALFDGLQDESTSLSEWLHEQLRLTLSSPSFTAAYHEIESPEELRHPAKLLHDLKSRDWSFTHDDTSYLSHDVHPYPAKFVPQIPAELISRLSLRGDLVFDPFGGSGTTALEALRLGRRAIIVDANPIGTLICRVKTARPTPRTLFELGELRDLLRDRYRSVQHGESDLIAEFGNYVPAIPNITKWFPATSCGELALIRSCMCKFTDAIATDIAQLALSRTVLRVSFQDSETRYASKPREVASGTALLRFLKDVDLILAKVLRTAPEIQFGVVQCVTADTRAVGSDVIKDSSVDLVVTSPPYGNANDYHLYHRFRLYWLGWNPTDLARIEIGSHLRHQKEGTGVDAYLEDMLPCMNLIHRALRPGRFCALVIGDPIYEGKRHDSVQLFSKMANDIGFERVGVVNRPIHATKRSFLVAGRRATHESILLIQKPAKRCSVTVKLPNYRLWPYESELVSQEIGAVLRVDAKRNKNNVCFSCDSFSAPLTRRLTFAKAVVFDGAYEEKTWQAILENGFSENKSSRKDPKYATHGIHPYKGKFYPQLAKALLNVAGLSAGAKVLDPFCGSGTTLLECQLNGLQAYGCDLHPLAARIARAKVGVLEVNPRAIGESGVGISKALKSPPQFSSRADHLHRDAFDEISRWFAPRVAHKLNWILGAIRESNEGIIRDFLEVVLSSCIREVSQQDPTDLRIRKRKDLLRDADVVSIFQERLNTQLSRLEKFWSVRGFCPYRLRSAKVVQGDARSPATFTSLGLSEGDLDLVLTSPPYATALPYIDTDRLSLLVLDGMTSRNRRPLEETLAGSREISLTDRRRLEGEIEEVDEAMLPRVIAEFIHKLYVANKPGKMGFRRQNLPALLLRFFRDMDLVLRNCQRLLRSNGEAIIVIGDSRTEVNGTIVRIPTTDFVQAIGERVGMKCTHKINITVTRENLRHIHHSITRNTVLRMKKN